MEFDQALLDRCAAPIPGEAPAGESARYEPQFESIQAEIEKLTALTGDAPNWSLVVENATELIAAKSKDALIVGYLVAGLYETRGWAGLADGLNVLKAVLAAFWEGLQPGKLRARKTAVDWLLDRCLVRVPDMPVQDADRSAMQACTTLVDELVAFGESRWEGDAPTLWSLGKEITTRIPAEAPAPVEPAAAEESGSPASAPAVGASAAPRQAQQAVPIGALSSREDAYRAIIAAAATLQAVEPHSPVPYLLRRAAAWGTMTLPALYAELQRAGTVWDLVLQQLPESTGSGGASPVPAPSPVAAPTAPVAPPAPEAEPAPAPRRRGDF